MFWHFGVWYWVLVSLSSLIFKMFWHFGVLFLRMFKVLGIWYCVLLMCIEYCIVVRCLLYMGFGCLIWCSMDMGLFYYYILMMFIVFGLWYCIYCILYYIKDVYCLWDWYGFMFYYCIYLYIIWCLMSLGPGILV